MDVRCVVDLFGDAALAHEFDHGLAVLRCQAEGGTEHGCDRGVVCEGSRGVSVSVEELRLSL